jgi:GTP-binding protein HflX
VKKSHEGATIQRRVVAFTVLGNSADSENSEALLDRQIQELSSLLGSLSCTLLKFFVQYRKTPDPRYYVGKGKILEIQGAMDFLEASIAVVDGFLTPRQRYALESLLGKTVWDRSEIILQIFEARAFTNEAKLQIALARYRREIPYLKGLGHQMSRLGGGIGTRGPGETEYVRHRRKLDRNIKNIERKLQTVQKQREYRRQRRSKKDLPLVALVGYTNSGKTTLLGKLARREDVSGSDKLFATLDTAVRKAFFPGGGVFLLSDTVGFIRNLPPELISSFRATLEEIASAQILLLVLDGESPSFEEDYRVVRETLCDIHAWEVPRICLINKIDALPEQIQEAHGLFLAREEESVFPVSALSGEGIPFLLGYLERFFSKKE